MCVRAYARACDVRARDCARVCRYVCIKQCFIFQIFKRQLDVFVKFLSYLLK